MALEVDTLVSTGATLAVGAGVVFDGVAIGASTGKMEVIKLADGTPGSSVMVAASSNGIGAVGLNTFVVNSTANPVGVSITAGQSTVTGSGVFHIDDNAASITVDFNGGAVSSANPVPMQLVSGTVTANIAGNSTAIISSASIIKVDTIGAFPANSSNVVISGNSTAIISSASIIKVDTIGAFPANSSNVVISGNSTAAISTAGAGGSSGNPLFVVDRIARESGSTFGNLKITSTALGTLFSSAASTRFNVTDLQAVNDYNGGGVGTVMTVYDGSTSGTILFQSGLSSGGGGIAMTFAVPRSGSSGNAIKVECVPSSTVFISAGAFKSA